MYSKITRANIASGASSGLLKVSSQEVNGLLFFAKSAQIGNGLLSVTLRPDSAHDGEKVEVLCNRIPLLAFAEISDINQGCSYGLNTTLQAIAAGLTVPQTIQDRIGFYIPFGKIDLDGGDVLEIVVEATGGAMDDLGIYTVDRADDKKEKIIKYEAIDQPNSNVIDPVALYAYRETAKANNLLHNDDLTITIKIGDKTFIVDAQGFWAGTVCFGNVEGQATHRIMELYDDLDDGLNGSLNYSMQGGDKDSYIIIAVSEVFLNTRISRKSIQIGQRMIDKIRRVETNSPDKARALRHMGRTNKALDLQHSIDKVKALNVKKPAGFGGGK
jgi:hypothetical protein